MRKLILAVLILITVLSVWNAIIGKKGTSPTEKVKVRNGKTLEVTTTLIAAPNQ